MTGQPESRIRTCGYLRKPDVVTVETVRATKDAVTDNEIIDRIRRQGETRCGLGTPTSDALSTPCLPSTSRWGIISSPQTQLTYENSRLTASLGAVTPSSTRLAAIAGDGFLAVARVRWGADNGAWYTDTHVVGDFRKETGFRATDRLVVHPA